MVRFERTHVSLEVTWLDVRSSIWFLGSKLSANPILSFPYQSIDEKAAIRDPGLVCARLGGNEEGFKVAGPEKCEDGRISLQSDDKDSFSWDLSGWMIHQP